MTASTMPHTARRTAARTTGRPHASRATGRAVSDPRPELRGAVALELDCEDGCHYCQGPETD